MQKGKLLILRYSGKLITMLVQENKLVSLQVYKEEETSLVGNIYVGKVQNIAKGLAAAFVEIEKGFTCFLPFSEVKNPIMVNSSGAENLRVGDELLVQVAKDAIKTKQPVLTTKLSVSGNYVAVSYGNDKLGLSNKLNEAKKNEIVAYLQEENLIDVHKKCLTKYNIGMIIRTNASVLTEYTILKEEWQTLESLMSDICTNGIYRTCFSCLYRNKKAYLADLRNFYVSEYDEIVTDCTDIYQELEAYFSKDLKAEENTGVVPNLRLYRDAYPLEKLYSVKTMLDEALQSRVWLKSGGYLVIEPTEALTVIDVNTGKYEAKKEQEEAVYHINMEAAEEISRQLKLRNISGIIIVDFINMDDESHCKEVLKRLETLLSKDRIPAKVVDMTPLGLVEITRKRVNRPIKELLS